MAILRVRRVFLARSLAAVLVAALGAFFIADGGAAAPRHSARREQPSKGRPALRAPRLSLAPAATPSEDAPREEGVSAASSATTTNATELASRPDAPRPDGPHPESASDEPTSSAPSGPSGEPSGGATRPAAPRVRPHAQALHVVGRVAVRSSEDDTLPVAHASVKLVALGRGDAPSPGELAQAFAAASAPIEARGLVRCAASFETAPVEIAAQETGDDGRFYFRVDRDRLREDVQLLVMARATLDGTVRAGTSDTHDLHGELVAFENDDWNVGVLRLEEMRSRLVRVSVFAGGRPVGGAIVVTDDRQLATSTDAAGRAQLELPDLRTLTVEASGYARATIELAGEGALEARVDLARPTSVSALVVDEKGQPISGASVYAYASAGPAHSTTTDAEGRATLLGLAPGGDYTIVACPPDDAGLIPASESVTAGTNAEAVRLVLAKGSSVAVELVFEDGLPAEVVAKAVSLVLESRDDEGSWSQTKQLEASDVHERLERGEMPTFAGLAAGTYRVTATPDPDQHLAFAFTRPFQIAAGASTRSRLEIGPGVVVSGWIRNTAGALVSSISVRFAEAPFKASGTNGFLEVRVPRTASLTAFISGDGLAESEVRLAPGDTRLPAMRLAPRQD